MRDKVIADEIVVTTTDYKYVKTAHYQRYTHMVCDQGAGFEKFLSVSQCDDDDIVVRYLKL